MKRAPKQTDTWTRAALCRGCWKNFIRERARETIYDDGTTNDDWARDGTMRICPECAAERWGKIVADGVENWRKTQ